MTHSYLIAPSHGAEIFGIPVTPGKRSPDGRFIEGVFTRRVVSGLIPYLQSAGVRAESIMTGPEHLGKFQSGTKKLTKWDWLNWLHKQVKDLIYIEVHTNAAGNSGWNNAKGSRIFMADGASRTTVELSHSIFKSMPDQVNSKQKKSRMYILTKTTCPVVLVELMFHTNRQETEAALGPFGHWPYMRGLYDGILGFDKGVV